MKAIVLIFSLILVSSISNAQNKYPIADSTRPIKEVEASCGLCQLGLKASDCALAVRIDGKSYFVDGTSIDEHGDAHAKDGFCNKIRRATVQGEIVDNRYKVTYFKLLPVVPAPARADSSSKQKKS